MKYFSVENKARVIICLILAGTLAEAQMKAMSRFPLGTIIVKPAGDAPSNRLVQL